MCEHFIFSTWRRCCSAGSKSSHRFMKHVRRSRKIKAALAFRKPACRPCTVLNQTCRINPKISSPQVELTPTMRLLNTAAAVYQRRPHVLFTPAVSSTTSSKHACFCTGGNCSASLTTSNCSQTGSTLLHVLVWKSRLHKPGSSRPCQTFSCGKKEKRLFTGINGSTDQHVHIMLLFKFHFPSSTVIKITVCNLSSSRVLRSLCSVVQVYQRTSAAETTGHLRGRTAS